MAGESGIHWIPGTLRVRTEELPRRLWAVVGVVVDRQESIAERDMKLNAPWKDQTGNARNTLGAKAKHFLKSHQLILHGGMPYQIYLELRWGGRFSVIARSVLPQGRSMMKTIMGAMGRAGGS